MRGSSYTIDGALSGSGAPPGRRRRATSVTHGTTPRLRVLPPIASRAAVRRPSSGGASPAHSRARRLTAERGVELPVVLAQQLRGIREYTLVVRPARDGQQVEPLCSLE